MELGALVCLPRTPKCGACPIAGFCRAEEPGSLPRKKPRRATVELEENCAVMIKSGEILLEQQIASRWRGLWKLPQLTNPPETTPLLQLDYPFTHHRVTLSVFKRPARTARADEQWHPLHALPAMPAPHLRALRGIIGNC